VKPLGYSSSTALVTMGQLLSNLRHLDDRDEAVDRLIEHIEGDRAWLVAESAAPWPPRRPPAWVRRAPNVLR
jgi:hypothetical protein